MLQDDRPKDYIYHYEDFEVDVLGDDDDDTSDDDYGYYGSMSKKKKDKEGEGQGAYMVFDFRQGPSKWPAGADLVDPQKANELLAKVIQ